MGEHKRNKTFRFRFHKGPLTIFILIVVVCGVLAVDFHKRSNYSPLADFAPERTKGNPKAPLQILEFVDFPCKNCAQGSRILKRYMNQYPDEIRLSIKYFPLGQINSSISAVYAQCAAKQDRFWPYHDVLFQRQDQWRTMLRVRPYFEAMAKEVGMDMDAFDQCVEKEDVKKTVAADKKLGQSYFVKSTPTYFINEEMVVGVSRLQLLLKIFFDAQREGSEDSE